MKMKMTRTRQQKSGAFKLSKTHQPDMQISSIPLKPFPETVIFEPHLSASGHLMKTIWRPNMEVKKYNQGDRPRQYAGIAVNCI